MTRYSLTKQDLADYFAKGEKPRDSWKVGTEHEKFLFHSKTLKRLSFLEEGGIQYILQQFQSENFDPIYEKQALVALRDKKTSASISLEPGGQFELSGAPLSSLHETYKEVKDHLDKLSSVLSSLEVFPLFMGFDPLLSRDQIPWMPKGRYSIMRSYMPQVGSLGLDMMTRTCTVQANLDYESETDMAEKMRIAMALQPLITALFASSPFLEGKLNGFQSYRSYIWQHTDKDRCGVLPFVFEEGFGYERYVDYLLSVPMYFVYREGNYINAAGASFLDFMNGKLAALPEQLPTLTDWADQTTIAFPEVRLKQYIETRGADAGPFPMLVALPALWVGLLYDEIAQDHASQLIKGWSISEILEMYHLVPKRGLETILKKRSLQLWAQDIVTISAEGLKRRQRVNKNNQDESIYLAPLQEIAATGRTLSKVLIDLYHNEWGGDVKKIFEESGVEP